LVPFDIFGIGAQTRNEKPFLQQELPLYGEPTSGSIILPLTQNVIVHQHITLKE
jgi:hypothetical protein